MTIAHPEPAAHLLGPSNLPPLPAPSHDILPENREMQHICRTLGFRLERAAGDPTVRASIELWTPGKPSSQ